MFIRQSSVVIRRKLVLQNGGYDERLRLSEDYDLFLRIADCAPAIAIERSLVVYNRRERSLSVDPLAEVASIDRLWDNVLEHPSRYPATVVHSIRLRRPAMLRMGCRIAMRLGRFAEAKAFAHRAWTVARSASALLLLGASFALNNAAGRQSFRGARALWRRRPAKWVASARLRSGAAHATVEGMQIGARQEPLFP
jgi:hypothetical protein